MMYIFKVIRYINIIILECDMIYSNFIFICVFFIFCLNNKSFYIICYDFVIVGVFFL